MTSSVLYKSERSLLSSLATDDTAFSVRLLRRLVDFFFVRPVPATSWLMFSWRKDWKRPAWSSRECDWLEEVRSEDLSEAEMLVADGVEDPRVSLQPANGGEVVGQGRTRPDPSIRPGGEAYAEVGQPSLENLPFAGIARCVGRTELDKAGGA